MTTNDDKPEDKRPIREKLAHLFDGKRMRLVNGPSTVVTGTPPSPPTEPAPKPEKPRLTLLEAGPTMTLAQVIAFGEKLMGRPPTAEELEEMRKELGPLGIK